MDEPKSVKPKITISYDKVEQAAQSLKQSGAKITVAALKEKLGGGSYPTISRYLKQWRHNLGLEQDKPAPVQSGDKPHVQHDTPQAQVEKSKPQASSGQSKPASTSAQGAAEPVIKVEYVEVKSAEDKSKELQSNVPTSQKATSEKSHAEGQHHASSEQAKRPRGPIQKRAKSKFRKDNRGQKHNSQGGGQMKHHHYDRQEAYPPSAPASGFERLESEYGVQGIISESQGVSDPQLQLRVRKLEAMLVKEQSRRECAEKMVLEIKDYAETLKAQVTKRIDDFRQSTEQEKMALMQQIKLLKSESEQDLKYYRSLLEQANQKFIQQAKGE